MRSTKWAASAIVAFLAMSVAVVLPLPYFLEKPGTAQGLRERITVDAPSAEPVDGDYLLVTVALAPSTFAELVGAWLNPTVGVVSVDEVIPPGQTEAAYFAHQQDVFEQSARRAAAVGLRAAGFEIGPVGGDGALVLTVLPGSAADGALLPGDVILAVDGGAIATDEALREAISAPGPVRLTVRREGKIAQIEVRPRPVDADPARPIIGVEVTTLNATIDLPVPFEVDSSQIGGPSAGLMIALAVFDMVDPLDLASGRRIAGTGTISLDGAVGLISGIQQKVIAAHRQGVDVFLAPAEQLAEAKAGLPDGSDLRVIGVTTFDEAVAALRDRS